MPLLFLDDRVNIGEDNEHSHIVAARVCDWDIDTPHIPIVLFCEHQQGYWSYGYTDRDSLRDIPLLLRVPDYIAPLVDRIEHALAEGWEEMARQLGKRNVW